MRSIVSREAIERLQSVFMSLTYAMAFIILLLNTITWLIQHSI